MPQDLEIDLLRTFVAVADHKNFTRAATALGRTQSAISMRLKRLEEIVTYRVFERTKNSVTITAEGETLLFYANRILQLNDEALCQLTKPEAEGLVRIGAPDDYATYLLPKALSSFSKTHPLVRLEVICDNGSDLLRLLKRGKLDLVLATHLPNNVSGEIVRKEQLHWVASPGFFYEPSEPLPLVLFPQGCVCRDVALRALEDEGRTWRLAYSTRSIALIHTAVASGSGVTVMEASTIPGDLDILDGEAGFPALGDVVISLHRGPGAGAAATALASAHIARELRAFKN